MSQRVFITGFGIITSIGKNAEENYRSLIQQHCGFGEMEVLDTIHRKSLPVCEIKLSHEQLCTQAGVGAFEGFTRTTLLGLIAMKEAINSAGISEKEIRESGLLSATTTGGIREFEKYYYELLDKEQQGEFLQFIDTANPGEHCERMAEFFGVERYLGTVSTACSSSANTIMLGAQLIKHKKLERVICGGAEALSKFTVNGFNTLMILDPGHCKPFDKFRSGLNLGEGAAYLVLESEGSVKRSNRTVIGEIKGYGNANDAFHQTASSPEGAGALKAMELAMTMAALGKDDINYINAHGTATENNDLSEGLAIQKLFERKVPDFSSTKPYTGHTLAAAGCIEAVFCLLALKHQVIFPNINFQHRMAELDISPVKEIKWIPGLKNIMSNSFGFGGNTSSIILSSVE